MITVLWFSCSHLETTRRYNSKNNSCGTRYLPTRSCAFHVLGR